MSTKCSKCNSRYRYEIPYSVSISKKRNMKIIITVHKCGPKKYKALHIKIPRDIVKSLKMCKGQHYIIDINDWELLEEE